MRSNFVLGCVAAAVCAMPAAAGGINVTTTVVASGLSNPVGVTSAPGDADRLFVIEQAGRVRIIENGTLLATPALDINPLVVGPNFSGDERGLLGIAFHPDFQSNGLLYLHYTGSVTGLGLASVISEYQMTGNTINPASARVLMEVDQPFSNHNAGWIGFGPDDMLYIGMGDGGSGNDPGNRAQNLGTLLGKMLRIDPTPPEGSGGAYTIPADNPFLGNPGALNEIWAYGLRNPYRNGFDSVTGDLWIGDVGQFTREEVNFQPASSAGGENYGWRCREGLFENPNFSGCTNSLPPVVDPIFDYARSGGNCSIIGGYVYNGCAIPELVGQYVYADYCVGTVFAFNPDTGARTTLVGLGFGVVGFGEDIDGELYVARISAGQIVKIVPTTIVDTNKNGIPDSCEGCPADVNKDGTASPADFTAWLSCFNDPGSAPFCGNADVNGSGTIDPADFTAWLAAFNAGCN